MPRWPERTLEQRLYDSAVRTQDGCLVRPGAGVPAGYKFIGINGKNVYAHRLSLEMKLGRPIKEGFQSCHTCDNPPCIEQSHLFEGTQSQNLLDAGSKGRNAMQRRPRRGEDNPAAKLTNKKAERLRKMYASGKYTQKQLAERFDICQSQVSAITRGESF